ncbi:BRD1 [Hepatospora eriocheir]|uniref:BRD1 n=1 Tax=Hepatospora eriocheir TaxID=1081669 RepID=A0A1X0QJB4_9MICR|nr:BRD1 [Hepatospora eriocheir]
MTILDNFTLEFIATNPRRREIIERQTTLVKRITKVLNVIKKEPKAAIFLNKVTEKEAPSYFSIIKFPMDLGTVSKKVHLYRNISEFKSDLDLIWNNCLKYNVTGEYYRDCAYSCKELADSLLSGRQKVYFNNLESINQEGIPFRNIIGLEQHIAEYFHRVGFDEMTKETLEILTSALEYYLSTHSNKFK